MRTGVGTLAAAKRLRREMTRPELDLWFRLKRVEGGPRFRRQHPLGPYVLDFYCPAARLVVEVDGIGHCHGDQPERDARRDAWLAAQGLEVMRITASDVLADPDDIADGVFRYAVARASPPPSRA
jgi:very-short-patch-repair endonuclease